MFGNNCLWCCAHLDKEAKVGNHSKATILELLDTELCKAVGVISQTKGVEWATCKRSVPVMASLHATAACEECHSLA